MYNYIYIWTNHINYVNKYIKILMRDRIYFSQPIVIKVKCQAI